MDVLVVVNDVDELSPRQSTVHLARSVLGRGLTVGFGGVGDLYVAAGGAVGLSARPLLGDDGAEVPVRVGAPEDVALRSTAAVLLRTSPGRDTRAGLHAAAMTLLSEAEDQGAVVVNAPGGLVRAGNKGWLLSIPESLRPRMVISRHPSQIEAFAASEPGPVVVKPLTGSLGRDVFLLRPEDRDNRSQMIEAVTRQGFAVAQEYLPGAPDGDVRVLVLDGRPLDVEGRVAAVRRVPGDRSFRSNVSAGGHAVIATATAAMLDATREIGQRLLRLGVRFAGIDFVGDRVVEVNVHSPGGLTDADAFYGLDFTGHAIDALLAGSCGNASRAMAFEVEPDRSPRAPRDSASIPQRSRVGEAAEIVREGS